jgi:hypothetical protein
VTAAACVGIKLRPSTASGSVGTGVLCAAQAIGLCAWLVCALGLCPPKVRSERFGPADDVRPAPKRPSLVVVPTKSVGHCTSGDSNDDGTLLSGGALLPKPGDG